VKELGVDHSVGQYIRAIAGTHYDRARDTLVVSCDKHQDQAVNRREVIEQLTQLVLEAKRLRQLHGPFPQTIALPRYSH
jgi:Mitochondrial ribosomal subunit protein